MGGYLRIARKQYDNPAHATTQTVRSAACSPCNTSPARGRDNHPSRRPVTRNKTEITSTRLDRRHDTIGGSDGVVNILLGMCNGHKPGFE